MLQTLDPRSIPVTLAELAVQINAEHEQCERAWQSGLNHARLCGEFLIEARRQLKELGHGNWLSWLAENCPFARSTAYAYIQVARDWSKLQEFPTVGNLTFRDALKLLGEAESKENDEIIDAEFVEEPQDDRHAEPTPANLKVGDRALVVKRDHLHYNSSVTIMEVRSGLYLAELPNGDSYLFMPTELRQIEALEVQEPIDRPSPPERRPSKIEILKDLLDRIYNAIGIHLEGELLAEVEKELGYR